MSKARVLRLVLYASLHVSKYHLCRMPCPCAMFMRYRRKPEANGL